MPGSDYLTHSIATMARVLREDPGSLGMVSGVGMHMTKHVYGVYSTEPGPARPGAAGAGARAARRSRSGTRYAGPATVAAYSVVHGRDGGPEWGVAVCDVGDGARAYAKMADAELLASAETDELVGRTVTVTTNENVNTATLVEPNEDQLVDVVMEFDPLSADFFDDPYETYRWLRDERARATTTSGTGSGRCPATTTWCSRSRDWQTFTSTKGITLDQLAAEGHRRRSRSSSIIFMDPPDHERLRRW